jgi:hypothetical protein
MTTATVRYFSLELWKIIHIPEKDSFKITIKDIVKYKRKISSVITFQYVGKEYVFFDYEEFDILEHSLDYIKNAIQNIIKNVIKN